jgi:hypothetical protein
MRVGGRQIELRLSALLVGSRVYWRSRRWAAKLRFRSRRFGFGMTRRGAAIADEFSARRELTRGLLRSSAVAVLTVAALWALQTWRFQILEFLHLDHWRWIEHQAHRRADGSSYDTTLQTLAEISGIFLALYLGFVSTVAATVYTAVPHDIRNLMLQDKVGNAYVRGVALLTAVAGLLSIGRAAGSSAWVVALPVLAALTLFAIYAFVRLGLRAFYFFDPSILAARVEFEFRRWANRAKGRRHPADDPSFQSFYRDRARESVGSIVALVRISTLQENLDSAPVERLTSSIVRTLRYYVRIKHEIPAKSLWFGHRLRHKPWFLADSTELMLAVPTRTLLEPQRVPDEDWVEEALFGSMGEILDAHLKGKRYDAAAELLYVISSGLEDVSLTSNLRLAMQASERLVRRATEVTLSAPTTDPVELRGVVAVLETAMALLISVEIGVLKAIGGAATGPLRTQMTSPESISSVSRSYRLPSRVRESLAYCADALAFERESKAPTRTPPWFVTETVLNTYALALEDQLRELAPWAASLTLDLVERALAAQRPVEAAALASRSLELAGRLYGLYADAEEFANRLAADAKLGDDIVRPRWDWAGYRIQLDQFEETVGERLARTIGPLALLNPREDIPDYLGQAVHQAGEACYDALEADAESRFASLYRHYFIGALSVFDRLRGQLADRHPMASLPWLAQPITDLLTLSGYALIFAEFYGKPDLWRPVKEAWDNYLNSEHGENGMQIVAALVAAREGSFAIAPRDLVRSWDGRFGAKVSELPRTASAHTFGEGSAQHESPLIVQLGRGGYSISGRLGLDVFIARYLLRHPLAAGVSFEAVERRIQRIQALPPLGAEQ